MTLNAELRGKLDDLVNSNKVVLFMKGNSQAPQCGFSAAAVEILDDLVDDYETVDVLADTEMRNGIKVFSDWPTIPQLYIGGELIGGCDIMREMEASGELHKSLGVELGDVAVPAVTVTLAAAAAIRKVQPEGSNDPLRIRVNRSFQYDMGFAPAGANDLDLESNGIRIAIDRMSAPRAEGLTIDYVTEGLRTGFTMHNPNEPPEVQQLSASDLKAWMDEGKEIEIFDVRIYAERAIATIPTARHFDSAAHEYIKSLPKDRTLVFHCHHGGGSQQVADQIRKSGFTSVYNLSGGIDAWSMVVDDSVARY